MLTALSLSTRGYIYGAAYGSNAERYATLAQLRNEGLPDPPTDAQALILLERASQLVESLTGNFFEERSGTFIFDGSNSHLMLVPHPIVSVTSLTINNDETALEDTEYRVYDGNQMPRDDRFNPKIELRRNETPSIFTGGVTQSVFKRGYDQTIEGSFGFLEPDGTVPAVINECVIAIVMTTWQDLFTRFSSTYRGGGSLSGPLKREKVDDHELEFWQPNTGGTDTGLVVPDYIHTRLKLYRAPLAARVVKVRWDYAGAST
jgi:hypothetical protein